MFVHGDAQETTRQKHLQGLLQNIPSGEEILPCATASAATCYGWVHWADKIVFTLQHFSCRCFSQGKGKGFKQNRTKNRICSQATTLSIQIPQSSGYWRMARLHICFCRNLCIWSTNSRVLVLLGETCQLEDQQ